VIDHPLLLHQPGIGEIVLQAVGPPLVSSERASGHLENSLAGRGDEMFHLLWKNLNRHPQYAAPRGRRKLSDKNVERFLIDSVTVLSVEES